MVTKRCRREEPWGCVQLLFLRPAGAPHTAYIILWHPCVARKSFETAHRGFLAPAALRPLRLHCAMPLRGCRAAAAAKNSRPMSHKRDYRPSHSSRCPCRSRLCFPWFFDGFRAIFHAELPPRLLGCVRTGTLPFCVCISMGGRTCPKWAVFARFRFYGRCRIALAPANRAAWRRSHATTPPGASHRIAHGDEAPQARGTMGMRETIVFAPRRGATYCVHYIYARMQGLKIICQRGWRDATDMPKGMA